MATLVGTTKETEHGKILLFGFFFLLRFDGGGGYRISRSVSNPVVNEPASIYIYIYIPSVINGRVNSQERRVLGAGGRFIQDFFFCFQRPVSSNAHR